MAQVQQIYARLFTHIDITTSLLLKQDLVDVEFVKQRAIRTSNRHAKISRREAPTRMVAVTPTTATEAAIVVETVVEIDI